MRIKSLGKNKSHLNSCLIAGEYASFCIRYYIEVYDRKSYITKDIYSVI